MMGFLINQNSKTMGLPTISLATLSRKDSSGYTAELKKLAAACSTWGFIYLIDLEKTALLKDIFEVCQAYFSLAEEEKMKQARRSFKPENTNRYRGYFPIAEGSNTFKEGFEIGWNNYKITGSGYVFDEYSVFPEPEPVPAWRDRLEDYFSYQLEIGHILLQAFEVYFKLPQNYFVDKFKNTLSTLRLLHYPALSEDATTNELQAEGGQFFTTPAHTDSGIITLLLQDETGGLQVERSHGEWVEAPPLDNALVVNIGDLLQRWTGGEFVATNHRVRAPKNSRFSIPFFFEPEGKAIIQPFKQSASFEPITYEAYLYDKIAGFVEYQ